MTVRRWLGAGFLVGAGALALTACHGTPHEFTVTSTADGSDASAGDGICEVTPAAGDCTLRAAIDEANAAPDTVRVLVPEGTYVLAQVGSDDTNAGGDIDLRPSGRVEVTGLGAGASIQAPGLDGVLDAHSGTAAVTNISMSGAGGAGLTVRSGATANVPRSSFHHNGGPGVQVQPGGSANLLHSTVSTNGGGGVQVDGTVVADYVTVTANTGGGVTGSGSATVGQSIIARQASGTNCAVPVTSGGWNAADDTSCALTGTGDWNGGTLDPLPPLGTDLVPFHLLSPGSGLLDSIPADSGVCGTALKTIDQRNAARPVGRGCDRGAIEAGGRSFTVTSGFDVLDANPGDGMCDIGNGTCTLRAAITEANTSAGADTITLAASPTLTRAGISENANLTGDLDVLDPLTLVGDGRTINGAQIDRVIEHRAGWLEIRDTAITGGRTVTSASGGGIASPLRGGVTLVDVEVWGNQAGSAAGVQVSGNLWMERSVVRDNMADQNVGGLSLSSSGTSTIVDSTISGNRAVNANTGGLLVSGDLDLTRSTISANRAKVAGGGITVGMCASRFDPCTSEVEIASSTVTGNTAQQGGGLFIDTQTWDSVTVVASTIVDNVATGNPSSSNRAGGGIYASGPISVGATVVANNTGRDCWSPITTLGANLDRDATCGFGATDLPSGEPNLAPLADNGGPTHTHLPYAISPVLDAIPAGTGGLCDSALPVDQRGQVRPAGAGCDVGAVEGYDPRPLPMALVVDTAADGADLAPGDTTCAAAGGCTLRAAIDEVNASPHPLNRITIAPGIDPTLSLPGIGDDDNATGDLDLLAPVTVFGGGASIDAAGIDRVLDIASTGVVIDRTTIRGGRLPGPFTGGGIVVRTGGLTLERSTVTDNRLTGDTGLGAGIAAMPSTTVVVRQSTLSGNRVDGWGGRGGAIYANESNFSLLVSTVSGNHAFAGAGIDIASTLAVVTVRASTFTANTGWYTLSGGGRLSMRGSAVGPGSGLACLNGTGSDGTSTSFDATCGFTPALSNVDPLLGPLADNGGPTLTHRPLLESPLRDRIVPGADCEQTSAVDQRGQPRPQGTGCDIGSVEGP